MTTNFRDNVVILTRASQGIGEQLAYQLADQGAKLVLAARNICRTGKNVPILSVRIKLV